MTSKVSAPSLPTKKRKPSLEEGEDTPNLEEAANPPAKILKGSHDTAAENERKNSLDGSVKKSDESGERKISFDESFRRKRAGSLDILAEGADRKYSHDSSLQLSGSRGKDSQDSSIHLDELFREEASHILPALAKQDPSAIEHLDALGVAKRTDDDNSNSTGQRILEQYLVQGGSHGGSVTQDFPQRRERLESWGGMSDLSFGHVGGGSDPNQLLAAISSSDPNATEIPSKISLQRDRLNSLASVGELSASGINFDNTDSSEIQAYVTAQVAKMGDQLWELAENMETNVDDPELSLGKESDSIGDSDAGHSESSPMIGASLNRPRGYSESSGRISVDFQAVAAAVDATKAAGALDLSALNRMAPPRTTSASSAATKQTRNARRSLPIKNRNRGYSSSSNEGPRGSALSDSEKDSIRERARLAAGYIPPRKDSSASEGKPMPLKKRLKRDSPEANPADDSPHGTPKHSNRTLLDHKKLGMAYLPDTSGKKKQKAKAGKGGQANQKWEGMFQCLLDFVEQRKEEETRGLSEQEKSTWVWDGNVPTTYETSDGKKLGRWVNNQRTAKGKGTLKDDREQRLVDAGLKWAVLSSNSWNLMLDELRIYIGEQVKNGRKWDGNVPTNYQIKTRPDGKFAGEDKNLGRWVNRQRNLYQSGNLREDRKRALEALGLKWSMLSTNTWDSMFETLEAYVDEQIRETGSWDGNVPSNYRTSDNPPRALGRWINRQRTAYTKGKLKDENAEKLENLGLKWSIHAGATEEDDDDDDNDESHI